MEPSKVSSVNDRVSTLRHDVMNPLTVVLCYSKLLLGRDDLPSRVREYVRMIATEAERCVQIFEDDKNAHATVQPDVAEPAWGASTQPAGEGNVSILVVEDDEGIRMLAVEVLVAGFADRGIRAAVDCVADRSGALDRVREGHYDAMVIDLNIDTPSGGIELLAGIDASRPGAASRTVMISGGVLDTMSQKLLDRMGIPLLEKPFSINDLVRAVSGIVRKTGRSNSGPM